jgi:hypothetical protein
VTKEKLTICTNQVFDDFPMLPEAQALLGKLTASCVTSIPESGDLKCVRTHAAWILPALAEADRYLFRHRFQSGYRAIGQANAQAHRIAAYIQPQISAFDMGSASVALAWYHIGAPGRDWFFHLVFAIEPEYSQTPLTVRFCNGLDKNGARLHPSCLEQPKAAA